MEPAPTNLLAVGDRLALLTAAFLKSGSGRPDPPRRQTLPSSKSGETLKRLQQNLERLLIRKQGVIGAPSENSVTATQKNCGLRLFKG
jgi:hypothetical protein